VAAHQVAGATPDPELPMLTVADLGIMRDVTVSAAGVTVTITPTYSGCARPPAPACPRCRSPRTRRTAEFSATACKSLYRCDACDEPFEGVKAL
jgi:hypothetical protein